MEENSWKKKIRLGLSAVLFVLVLCADKFSVPFEIESNLLRAGLYAVPYLLAGGEVVVEAFEDIFHGELFDEEFLMTLASIAAFAIGEYPEAVLVMILFGVGEMFEDYAVGRSRSSIDALLSLAPETALVIGENTGEPEEEPCSEISVGSVLLIRPGDRIGLDGTVIEGESFADTSALTGEPVPVRISQGTRVFAGFVNQDATVKMRTTAVFTESALSKVMRQAELAAEKKSVQENFITKFAKFYTPFVTLSAVILAVLGGTITGDWSKWFLRACSFLVISCPCALVISVPMGFFCGIGAASRRGILVKGSNVFEAVAKLDTICFDKTGTLTKGEFEVTGINPQNCEEQELLKLAASAEAEVSHPIGRALVRKYLSASDDMNRSENKLFRVLKLTNKPGCGIEALLEDQRTVRVGNASFICPDGFISSKQYGTIVYVSVDDRFYGSIELGDSIKTEAAEAVGGLKKLGVSEAILLTGDDEGTAAHVAKETGVDKFRYGLLPGDKVTCVEEEIARIEKGRTLGFVGDGINDAPVLRRADVGIAMGGLGSDVAIEAADVVLMDDNLRKLPTLLEISRKTLRIVRTNIIFALAVKAAALVLGAFGIVSMWLAVFADVGVTVIAVLNSLRAQKVNSQ